MKCSDLFKIYQILVLYMDSNEVICYVCQH